MILVKIKLAPVAINTNLVMPINFIILYLMIMAVTVAMIMANFQFIQRICA